MRPIVSDSGPLHYLVLIEAVDILSTQFGHVLIPEAVAKELSHPATPSPVRAWLAAAPTWLERQAAPEARDFPFRNAAQAKEPRSSWPSRSTRNAPHR